MIKIVESKDFENRQEFGKAVVIQAKKVLNDEFKVIEENKLLKFENASEIIPKTKQKYLLEWDDTDEKFGNISKFSIRLLVRKYVKKKKDDKEFTRIDIEKDVYENIKKIVDEKSGGNISMREYISALLKCVNMHLLCSVINNLNQRKRNVEQRTRFIWEYEPQKLLTKMKKYCSILKI